MTDRTDHWDAVYATRDDSRVSWFDPDASESFDLVTSLAAPGDPILDVGAGTSALAHRLITAGYGPVSVLDISAEALQLAQERLGPLARSVEWIRADIARWTPPAAWALWHDRAVFHFLTDPRDRAAYIAAMATALRPGGHAVLSTFADDGPETCSGLPVVRYAPEDLGRTLADLAPDAFKPVASSRHVHRTPGGADQRFQTTVFRRLGDDADDGLTA